MNITLCFSQERAAAMYAATHGATVPVYVSPFVGRLDDRGENGMDLIKNIQRMYLAGDGHVQVLAASIRSLDHLLECFALNTDLVTVPGKVLEQRAAKAFPMPDQTFSYRGLNPEGSPLTAILYRDFDLSQPWETFDLWHDLTTKGIQRFIADFQRTLGQSTP